MVAQLIKLRGFEKAALTRIETFLTTVSSETSIISIKDRLVRLKKIFSKILEYESALPQEQSEMDEIENRYFDAKEVLQLLLEPTTRDELTMDLNSCFLYSSFGTTSDFRMSRLNIPVFYGDYNQWLPFKDLFKSVVHNNKTLTNIQRFQYLLGLLGEGPMAVIQHIPVTNDSYEDAWTKLMNRYDKKKQIVNNLLATFFSHHSISHVNASNLRLLADNSEQVVRGLKCVDRKATEPDVWIICMLLNKVDPETRRLWLEKTVYIDFPSFDVLIQFLNDRASTLESSKIETLGQVLRANGEPIGQNTRLGWFVAGNIKYSQITNLTSANLNIYDDLKRFWEIESIPAAKTPDLTPEEKFCEEHFLSNSKINSDSRFEVKLPFLKTNLKLGNSYNSALLRLKAIERIFLKDPEICKLHMQFMRGYIDLGHMKQTDNHSIKFLIMPSFISLIISF
ncbi:uncharacterized protein CDAR_621401 [Caerostris darwini]|uniref:Uncharacterized protein n=1 Tax=Caerostris darwini TaxID=1538125 RepID=A0AAV4S852_9ARAC|nr:uncharacterized protein CDAR_621401 [Caerostris darwini]